MFKAICPLPRRRRPPRLIEIERIVVAADVDPPRTLAGQDGDHVAQVHGTRDAPAYRNLMRVEAHLQPLAGALHLFQDPLTRGADAAGGESVLESVLRVPKLTSFSRSWRIRCSEMLARSAAMRGSVSAGPDTAAAAGVAAGFCAAIDVWPAVPVSTAAARAKTTARVMVGSAYFRSARAVYWNANLLTYSQRNAVAGSTRVARLTGM